MDLTTRYYPAVIAYSPTTATTGVGTLPNITVEFSMPVEQTQFSSTINQYMLLVNQNTGESVDLVYSSYNSSIDKLTVVPSASLTNGQYYQVTVLNDVVSEAGRQMANDVTWVFQVDADSLLQTTLIAPATNTSHTTIPTLVWSAVASALNYDVYIATSPQFNTEALIYSDPTSSVYLTPDTSLFTDTKTYYWKVRATSGTTDGPWSDYRSFFYGTFVSAAIDSKIKYPRASDFGATTLYPTSESSNQQSWPTISITFSDTVASGTVNSTNFDITYAPVDDDPSGSTGTLAGTLTTVGSSVVFTPTDSMIPNTKYTMTVANIQSISGNTAASLSYYFTSNYVPYYIGYATLRAKFGEFLSDYTIDFINRQIFLSSIECNKYLWAAYNSSTPSVSALKTYLRDTTYDMAKFVTVHSAHALLRLKRYELLEEADRRKQLGDFTVDVGSTVLTELGKILKDLEDEVEEIEVMFGAQTIPKVGVRSSRWNPSERRNDQSLNVPGMFKKTF